MIKKIRVLLSITILVLLTLLFFDMSCRYDFLFSFLDKIQFIPALLSFTFGIVIFWLIATFLFGRAYCSTVCPMGTVQDAISRLKQRTNKKSFIHSTPRNSIRYSVLVIVIASILFIHKSIIYIFDPYTQYENIIDAIIHPIWDYISTSTFVVPSILGIIFGIITLIVIGLFSYNHGRLFCNSICPVGSTLSLVSRHSVFQFEVDTDACTHCGKCIDNCKSSCIRPQEMTIDMSRCVLCFNCVDICGDNAIRYSASRKRLSTPLMQSIEDIPQVTAVNFPRRKGLSTIKKTNNPTI